MSNNALRLPEIFMSRVLLPIDGSTSCWEWIGNRSVSGYGSICVNGRHERAHRVSVKIFHGVEIPDGYFVLHSCDHPWCVNPFHLRIGTRAENVRDSVERRRHANSKKVLCKRGHTLSHKGDGTRFCKKCSLMRGRKFRAKKKGCPALVAACEAALGIQHEKGNT